MMLYIIPLQIFQIVHDLQTKNYRVSIFAYILSSSTATPTKHKVTLVKDVEAIEMSNNISTWVELGAEKTYNTLMSDGLDDNLIPAYEKISVHLVELHFLRPKEWISDKIIDSYTKILERLHPENNSKIISALTLPLMRVGTLDVSRYDAPSISYTFVPIPWDDIHWTLVFVKNIRNEILHLDSTKKAVYEPKTFKATLDLIHEWLTHLKATNSSIQNFKTIKCDDIPKQNNDYDCGVFVLFFITLLFFDPERDLSTLKMPKTFAKDFRKHICFAIASNDVNTFSESWARVLSTLN